MTPINNPEKTSPLARKSRLCARIFVQVLSKIPRVIWLLIFIATAISVSYFYLQPSKEFTQLYNYYYPTYYSQLKDKIGSKRAHAYASHYARYYAEYFSSDAYKKSLSYALPENTKENLTYPASAIQQLALNSTGLKIIKAFEGFRAEAYRDVGGKLTIGYGHLLRKGETMTEITERDAENLLKQDIQLAEAVIKRSVTTSLTENQFSALVSLVYNIGEGHFTDSTMLKYINNGEHNKAGQEFERWVYVDGVFVQGLERRRLYEAALFNK